MPYHDTIPAVLQDGRPAPTRQTISQEQRLLVEDGLLKFWRAFHQVLELGAEGGYIFAPAHAVPGDVPVENLVAFIEEVKRSAVAA